MIALTLPKWNSLTNYSWFCKETSLLPKHIGPAKFHCAFPTAHFKSFSLLASYFFSHIRWFKIEFRLHKIFFQNIIPMFLYFFAKSNRPLICILSNRASYVHAIRGNQLPWSCYVLFGEWPWCRAHFPPFPLNFLQTGIDLFWFVIWYYDQWK